MNRLFTLFERTQKILKENNYFPGAQKLFVFLMIMNTFFILLHAYSLTLPLSESTLNLRLDMDFGYAERFQYFQYLSIATLLFISFFQQKRGVYLIWVLFFLLLFADDAFTIHEIFGAQLINNFDVPRFLGLRSQDIGELLVAAMLGLLFLLPLVHTFIWGSRKGKEISIHFIVLIGVFLFFGIGVDMLHSLLKEMPGSGALTVIEDAGEMISCSLILVYSFCLFLMERKSAFIRKSLQIKDLD